MLSKLLALGALCLLAEASPLLRLGGLVALKLEVNAASLNRSICLGPLGCFSNNPPFYDESRRPLSLLPFDRESLDVRFFLYTRRNPSSAAELKAEDPETLSGFSPSKDTKAIIHGYMDNLIYGGWLEDVKKEYLDRNDTNVILVDWARANRFPYEQSVANARAVGAELALLIKTLIETRGAKASSFHLVGHSLGAHIAGYVGQRIPGIARITGLDPAGPYFTGTDPLVRLDPKDADFVDVIHTDASTTVLSGLGTVQPMGHVDFYPNGGNGQPGCNPISNIPSIFYKGLARSLTNMFGGCDHQRAGDLFTDSIRSSSCSPVGLACSGWVKFSTGQCGDCSSALCLPMGEGAKLHYTPDMAGAKLFLNTADTEPFCQFQYKILIEMASGNQTRPVAGEAYLILQGDRNKLHTKLSKGTEVFRPNDKLVYLLTTSSDVGKLARLHFYWKEDDFEDTGPQRSRIHLERLTVSPLQVTDTRRTQNSGNDVFCFDAKEPIFPDQELQLISNGKC